MRCELDTNLYPKGVAVSDVDAININRAEFHSEWNHTISPTKPVQQSGWFLAAR